MSAVKSFKDINESSKASPKEEPKKRSRNWPFCVSQSEPETSAQTGLPFMSENSKPVINSSKILEVLIASGLTTLLVLLFAIPSLQEKITTLSKQIEEVKVEVREIRRDFYIPASRKPSSPNPRD